MRLPRSLVALIFSGVSFGLTVSAQASDWFEWRNPLRPCNGDCAFAVYAGQSVNSNVQDIFFKAIPPTSWGYDEGGIVAIAASRRIATAFRIFDIEAEAGTGKRFGNQQEGEFWGAIYVRYTAFPWNNFIYTTLGLSTGLNYATGISDFEKEHSKLDPPAGTHIQHFFSPELTFAMPDHKERQLIVRLHHRSGAYGIVSGALSGATYLTAGIRLWF